jgi:hypothetical protein
MAVKMHYPKGDPRRRPEFGAIIPHGAIVVPCPPEADGGAAWVKYNGKTYITHQDLLRDSRFPETSQRAE